MGQYYKVVNLDTKQWMEGSNFYCGGAKLMEHAYIGNDLCNAVESLLCEGNPWYKTKVVWCGDYGSFSVNNKNELVDLDDYLKNYSIPHDKLDEFKNIFPKESFYYNDYLKSEAIKNLYSLCIEKKEDGLETMGLFKNVGEYLNSHTSVYKHTIGRYIVNHTKKLFVDKLNLPTPDKDYWYVINPLPLLVSDGNGQGGGDFYTDDEEMIKLVGSWKGDIISIDSEEMRKRDDDGNYIYKELKVNFIEKH